MSNDPSTTIPPLDGPRRPAASGQTRSLVVFLHGYGANGDDLFSLSQPLSAILPDTAFASPNAPAPCEMGGGGFQWFGLLGPGGRMEVRENGAEEAAPVLRQFIEAELTRYRLDSSRLALVGFSQGTMMALQVGLRFDPAPRAIVGFSGMFIGAAKLKGEPHGTPPVLLIHGTDDQVLPYQALAESAAGLTAIGVPAETLTRPGLGHGIDDEGLRNAAYFLARRLGG